MTDINVNKLSEALNTKADIDLNNTGVFTTTGGGGVNLVSSTSADASGKEVTSADFVSEQITETKNLIPSNAEISGMPMPSSKYIDLTLGASGATYTAPANGWITLSKNSTATNQYIRFESTNSLGITIRSVQSGSELTSFYPCNRGDIVTTSFTATGATNYYRFVYAQGEQ